MLDSNNKQLLAALSDENWNFNFGKIPKNQNFKIILPDSINDLPGKKDLYFLITHGKHIQRIKGYQN